MEGPTAIRHDNSSCSGKGNNSRPVSTWLRSNIAWYERQNKTKHTFHWLSLRLWKEDTYLASKTAHFVLNLSLSLFSISLLSSLSLLSLYSQPPKHTCGSLSLFVPSANILKGNHKASLGVASCLLSSCSLKRPLSERRWKDCSPLELL